MKSEKSLSAGKWLLSVQNKLASAKNFRFKVKVVPGSSRNEIVGMMDEKADVFNATVKVKIAAPPEKSKANEELVKFLAKKLGVPAAAIRIAGGATSKIKLIEVKLS